VARARSSDFLDFELFERRQNGGKLEPNCSVAKLYVRDFSTNPKLVDNPRGRKIEEYPQLLGGQVFLVVAWWASVGGVLHAPN
jgi:hypothetical protein